MEIKEEKESMSEAIMKFEKVPFMGQDIQVTTDEPHYVALKPLFEGMKLDWSVVYRQIANDEVLMTSVANLQFRYPSGAKTLICLPMDMLHGLFFKINAHLYKEKDPERYANICKYQKECYKVLKDHFTQGFADNCEFVQKVMNAPRSELFRMLSESYAETERQEQLLAEQKETIRRIGDGLHEQTAMSIRLQGELIRTKAIADRWAPIGDCPDGYYIRRGSYCRKPKRRQPDTGLARQLLLGIPQTKDVSAEE